MAKKLFFLFALILSVSFLLIFSACDGDSSGGHNITVTVNYTANDPTETAYGILISGATCSSYTFSDIAYKASANLAQTSRGISYNLSGTMTMTNVAAGTYVACVFVDLDGLTSGIATTLASAESENGDAVTSSDLNVVLDGDKNYTFNHSDFQLKSK